MFIFLALQKIWQIISVSLYLLQCVKDAAMSPGAPAAAEGERTELLGSLTTQQQQRTSARVIKKLRLEPPADRDKRKPGSDGEDGDDCLILFPMHALEVFSGVSQRVGM